MSRRRLIELTAVAVLFAIIFGYSDVVWPDVSLVMLEGVLVVIGIGSERIAKARGYDPWSPYVALSAVAAAAMIWFAVLHLTSWLILLPHQG